MSEWKLDLGANPLHDSKWKFRVWAPSAKKVELILDGAKSPMEREDRGYYAKTAPASEGMTYAYFIDGDKRRADPASRFQPDGINGDSCLVDPSSFAWSDESWKGVALKDLIIYELHTGTFTQAGTFEGIISRLDYLSAELGVTAIEIMPIAQFPGPRNWGYDGVFMYAVQNSYGGPDGLKKLVNACHNSKLGVILDVVYNHVGPEGNYLPDFGPYFSSKYHTPWGPAINYDDRGSDEVRSYVIDNALYWINEYHVDGLRLDAIHGIFDFSPKHILREIKESVTKWKRSEVSDVHLIAESDLNDPKIILPEYQCGYGLSSQWSDDFHHSLHAYLTGEKYGYYLDFGSIQDIEKAIRESFVYDGRFSKYRNRTHGASTKDVLEGTKFVISVQNHDQIGNRPEGARLSTLLGSDSTLKLLAALLLLSPYVPMIFMGEEYGEEAPFYFFTSHLDPEIAEATRSGRKKEFEVHKFLGGEFVDPQDERTFSQSRINPDLRFTNANREIFKCFQDLITIRKSYPALGAFRRDENKIRLLDEVLVCERKAQSEKLALIFVLGKNHVEMKDEIGHNWRKVYSTEQFDSTRLPPRTATVYTVE